MKTKVETYRITCDRCKKEVIQEGTSLPLGWEIRRYSGGGHYGLPIHTDEICGECAADTPPGDADRG